MDQVKCVVIVFLIFTTLLRQLKAFECQLPREDDTITKSPQPVYYGTPSDVSVEGCGLQDPKTLTDSFPWDVVVYFREDVCVTPGVIISPRSILFGLESCKPEKYQEITMFIAGIHANYAAAPQMNVKHFAFTLCRFMFVLFFRQRRLASSLESLGCGRPQVPFVSLVAHGTTVPQDELHLYPWHALVEANYYNDELKVINHYCGGTIISETVIVTAAHCLLSESSVAGSVTRYDPHEVRVHGGVFKRSNTKEVLKQEKDSRQSREVKQIITHPEYVLNANTDDIALIIVKKAFDTSSIHVKPACLWNSNASPDVIVDAYGLVVGWGLEETFKINDTLRVADIPVIDHKKCFSADREFYNNRLWYGYNFCAGVQNGTSVCNGDSGGGFILYNASARRYYLRGIVSTAKAQTVDGKAVCDYSTYALFTDVARYVPWIMEHVLKNI
ncbi:CLIP domain-containing serine protease B4-like [Cloeon dipterum]|uniref:CLIP domain-containing serine protease B4-like n=1 Tax=Cloeon dipterum TaxID=197152 RepID=UPI00321FCD80